MRPDRRTFIRLLAPGFLCTILLPAGGCSFFKWTRSSGPEEPGIVILERKASAKIRGFNVYRINSEDGSEVKINSRIVEPASEITDDRGLLTYRVIDRDVIAGVDYYYIFEEIREDGSKHRWDTPQMMTAKPLSGN